MKRDAIEVNDRQVCFNSYVPILSLSATVNLKPIRYACRNFCMTRGRHLGSDWTM